MSKKGVKAFDPTLWKLTGEAAEPGTRAIEPILGRPTVEQNGRLFDPRDTNQATGPFVIGKLARDGVEALTSVVYGEDLPERPT